MTATTTDGKRLYRRLLGYVVPHWRAFVISIVALLVVSATEVGFAAFIKPLMDGSFVERDPEVIKWAPLVLIGLFLVRGIATYLSKYWMSWVARKVINVLRGEMFSQLLRLPVSFFDAIPSGTLLSKLIYDVEQVARATTDSITILVRDSVTVVGLLGWMFLLNWRLALVLMIGAPFIAQVINVINRRFRRYSTRIQDSVGDVTQIAEEAIEGQRVVKTFGGEGYETGRFEAANEKNRMLNMKLLKTNAASVPVVELVAATASGGVIYFALQEVDKGALSVGSFMSFITAMMMIHSPMKRLTNVTANLQRGIAASASIFSLIDSPAEPDHGTRAITRATGEVEYRGVSFSYPESQGDVLQQISLRVAPGQVVALVGRSGSGKSTLVGLLPRFYDVSQGQILLDGENIRELPLANLRDQISLVSQHITLFNDTIANNIAYGRLEGADREAIIAAAEAAHAMEFIRELPAGLDTMVGENGVLLSGGQRQRLAIARALLKDSPILILDEATSALDTESERHIQAALEQVMRNRTTLVIAHRLSTIEHADTIVVMERGRMIESGTHTELLEKNGQYAALYAMQFQEKS
ncbi:MAG: lipid A export permease/ATP-binding protein MsbA [Gammaproteobacteria bacterium]|nr:lipid A export permease/ATP-binding protein MsbA [Gammaproteobacteria bacterium]MCW8840410.1 lipid A export permease/ATP-binding protein MsbA [Gammaproteobacteria bacterium]MCW8928542.1 lipid A export permease/ATP-binding protein MsbA [Gammaproteobacteria bacterium]MCW8957589.1 lipid A export permease/ATP-binding protein MsbA [Gammaproteobacteria bacterium]MCW8973639.1 lipid A export permease/ATP-binding protein MsbA [Gammaproteobacteria bacterium]